MSDLRFVIMRGLPGSGKSTLAKSLGGTIVSADDHMMENGVYVFRPEKLSYNHSLCFHGVVSLFSKKTPLVVLDNTNTTWKEFARYVQAACLYFYSIEQMLPQTSWAFDVEECFNRNVHGVPRNVIQAMAKRFESYESIEAKIKEYEN